MQKLVINVFGVPDKDFIKCAVETGWDGVFTNYYDDGRNYDLARIIKESGLYYQSFHAPFDGADAIWVDCERGEREVPRQIKCLQTASELGVDTVVMHTIIGFDKHNPTTLGIERFGKIFDAAKKYGVKVALENTEGEEYLTAVMSAYKDHPAVGFCIDTGHEMCYNYSRDLIGKYSKKLIATHLNDNMGITGSEITWHDDSHLMPFDGVADWQGIATRLKTAGYNGPLTFELTPNPKPERNTHDIYSHLDLKGYISLALEKAKKFRDILEKQRKKQPF